jgi:hypothetical protein
LFGGDPGGNLREEIRVGPSKRSGYLSWRDVCFGEASAYYPYRCRDNKKVAWKREIPPK